MWSRSEGRGRDIVFVHGWALDHRDELMAYEPVFEGLPGWRRHYLDLPGMGRTPLSDRIADLDGYLDALQGEVEALTGGGRLLLAGTSAGAYLARGLLHRLPGRVDGLLLRAPLVLPDDADRDVDAVRPVVVDPSVMAAIPPSEREALGEVLVQTPAYLRALRDKVDGSVGPASDSADRGFLQAIRGDRRRYRLSRDPDAADVVFEGPSLIVAGRHDAVVGHRDAWRLAAKLPRCTFAVLDRADHGLPVDQRDLFGALVRDWLSRVEEGGAPRG